MSVKYEKQFVTAALIVITLSFTSADASASSPDDRPTALDVLRVKADQARPREKCFLYAKLVSQMTVQAGQQLSSGNSDKASETLDLVRQYTEKIHVSVADDGKNLKDAEVLLRQTIFRLKNILREAPSEDRPPLEATLEQLDRVQAQLMMQVFKQ
jgi:hypothetical protein